MHIRQATQNDLPSIVRLLADDPLGKSREQFEDPLPVPYYKAFEALREQGGHELVVAVDGAVDGDGDTVIGCLQMSFIPGISRLGMLRAQVEGVRVHDGHQGKGVGKALMDFAINRARAMGCGLVQLTTDTSRPEAHKFYEGLGFTASHIGMKLPL